MLLVVKPNYSRRGRAPSSAGSSPRECWWQQERRMPLITRVTLVCQDQPSVWDKTWGNLLFQLCNCSATCSEGFKGQACCCWESFWSAKSLCLQRQWLRDKFWSGWKLPTKKCSPSHRVSRNNRSCWALDGLEVKKKPLWKSTNSSGGDAAIFPAFWCFLGFRCDFPL